MAYIGDNDSGSPMLNFGKSTKFIQRELIAHRNTFTGKYVFNIQIIREVDACDEVEEKLIIDLKARKVISSLTINKIKHREIITLNHTTGLGDIKMMIEKLCTTTKLPSEVKYEKKIQELKTEHILAMKDLEHENKLLKKDLESRDMELEKTNKMLEMSNDMISLLKTKRRK